MRTASSITDGQASRTRLASLYAKHQHPRPAARHGKNRRQSSGVAGVSAAHDAPFDAAPGWLAPRLSQAPAGGSDRRQSSGVAGVSAALSAWLDAVLGCLVAQPCRALEGI
jgi:hypothetical protein